MIEVHEGQIVYFVRQAGGFGLEPHPDEPGATLATALGAHDEPVCRARVLWVADVVMEHESGIPVVNLVELDSEGREGIAHYRVEYRDPEQAEQLAPGSWHV